MRLFAHWGNYFLRVLISSRNCGASRDISSVVQFVPELWRFPGHFLSAATFVLELWRKPGHFLCRRPIPPGIVAQTRTFSFRGKVYPGIVALSGTFPLSSSISSRNCGANQDIFFHSATFVLIQPLKPGCFVIK